MSEEPSNYQNKPPTKISNVALDYTKHMGGCGLRNVYDEDKEVVEEIFFWLFEVRKVTSYISYILVQEQYS
jgi:hypothetical protein